jgi:hypothetical protein
MARTLASTRLKAQQAGEWLKDARRVTPLSYVGDRAVHNVGKARAYVTEWCRMMAVSIAAYVAKGR